LKNIVNFRVFALATILKHYRKALTPFVYVESSIHQKSDWNSLLEEQKQSILEADDITGLASELLKLATPEQKKVPGNGSSTIHHINHQPFQMEIKEEANKMDYEAKQISEAQSNEGQSNSIDENPTAKPLSDPDEQAYIEAENVHKESTTTRLENPSEDPTPKPTSDVDKQANIDAENVHKDSTTTRVENSSKDLQTSTQLEEVPEDSALVEASSDQQSTSNIPEDSTQPTQSVAHKSLSAKAVRIPTENTDDDHSTDSEEEEEDQEEEAENDQTSPSDEDETKSQVMDPDYQEEFRYPGVSSIAATVKQRNSAKKQKKPFNEDQTENAKDETTENAKDATPKILTYREMQELSKEAKDRLYNDPSYLETLDDTIKFKVRGKNRINHEFTSYSYAVHLRQKRRMEEEEKARRLEEEKQAKKKKNETNNQKPYKITLKHGKQKAVIKQSPPPKKKRVYGRSKRKPTQEEIDAENRRRSQQLDNINHAINRWEKWTSVAQRPLKLIFLAMILSFSLTRRFLMPMPI
jgi:hypothetical protein